MSGALDGLLHVTDPGDSALARALASGQANALPRLYDTYADRLFSYARVLTSDDSQASEAVAFALLDARDQISRLPDVQQLRPWLYGLTRRECLLRADYSDARSGNDPLLAATTVPTSANPDDIDRDTMAVRQALASLTTADREVIELVKRHGLTIEQCSRVLGLHLVTAKTTFVDSATRLERMVEQALVSTGVSGRATKRAARDALSASSFALTVAPPALRELTRSVMSAPQALSPESVRFNRRGWPLMPAVAGAATAAAAMTAPTAAAANPAAPVTAASTTAAAATTAAAVTAASAAAFAPEATPAPVPTPPVVPTPSSSTQWAPAETAEPVGLPLFADTPSDLAGGGSSAPAVPDTNAPDMNDTQIIAAYTAPAAHAEPADPVMPPPSFNDTQVIGVPVAAATAAAVPEADVSIVDPQSAGSNGSQPPSVGPATTTAPEPVTPPKKSNDGVKIIAILMVGAALIAGMFTAANKADSRARIPSVKQSPAFAQPTQSVDDWTVVPSETKKKAPAHTYAAPTFSAEQQQQYVATAPQPKPSQSTTKPEKQKPTHSEKPVTQQTDKPAPKPTYVPPAPPKTRDPEPTPPPTYSEPDPPSDTPSTPSGGDSPSGGDPTKS